MLYISPIYDKGHCFGEEKQVQWDVVRASEGNVQWKWLKKTHCRLG